MTRPILPRSHPEQGFSGHARDRILRAAAAAFSRCGFHGVTIRALAQDARVNLAAVNYHFRSKEELYAAVIDRALELWLAETVALDDLEDGGSLSAVVRGVISALISPVIEREEAPLLPRLIAWDLLQGAAPSRVGASPAIAAAVKRRLERLIPSSRHDDDLELVADWLVSQCLLMAPSFRPQGRDVGQDYAKLRHLADRIGHLALHGIAGLPGLRDQAETG
jgi:AcrR family transcriptional regulator